MLPILLFDTHYVSFLLNEKYKLLFSYYNTIEIYGFFVCILLCLICMSGNKICMLSMVVFFNFVLFQVSFLLGIAPVFVAWIYSEILEYKTSTHSKV